MNWLHVAHQALPQQPIPSRDNKWIQTWGNHGFANAAC